ncbi:hypothetical protein TIFTF001_044436 [Ficus carica]|uniref:Uncharacterized protein n=1 Tax=Ficus carica TaxID=3494 RepID=A0AA88CUF2_FICCA|nr:hypothetical protein TIFTF001_044417 [Ficus carica]GMN30174.1 hypothetical protein TIFTF001_044426 [Ficus carica]GMN30209.1 hypothetical protein TIFTF001_044427 [Ficus carica]GMN30222.1 hypothetical protein TIFTF001_044436 [Ficus carica]
MGPLRDRILLGWQVIVTSMDVGVAYRCNARSHRCGRPLNADISLKWWRLLTDVQDIS